MKKSNTSISNENQNTENKKKCTKLLNEISVQAQQSNENIKSDKKLKKFDKTTQSFSPRIIHNKPKIHSKYRELIIDTRNTPLNEYNHKFDFVKFRHEKYRKHTYPTNILKEKINLDKPTIIYQDEKTNKINIYEDKVPLHQKIKIILI